MSRGVGQSRVKMNTHTHKMILIWIYERTSEDLSATHTLQWRLLYLTTQVRTKKPGATIYLYCIWWFLERLIVVLVFRCYMNFYNDLKERKRTFYLLKKKKNIWKWFFLQREGIIVCLFGSFPFGSLDLTLNCEFDGLRLKSWFLLVILREIN